MSVKPVSHPIVMIVVSPEPPTVSCFTVGVATVNFCPLCQGISQKCVNDAISVSYLFASFMCANIPAC